MKRKICFALALSVAASAAALTLLASSTVTHAASATSTQGELRIVDPKGQPAGLCPLEHTDVHAEISGFLARVTVKQRFTNPSTEAIEAVYTFPLPDSAAVDRMTMHVGDRTVAGTIKRREEARAIYDAARNAGQVASLLDQERANIFTQSVANIMPGERVDIEISYVETLAYDDGSYSFVFPMVVGPRYIPGAPGGKQAGGWSPDTDQVPDASRITPPVAVPGTRAGHDISLEVVLDAGVPIQNISSTLHDVDVQRTGPGSATVSLKDKATIPNRDFILTYDVAGAALSDAVLSHKDDRGGFFTLILQPPARVASEDVAPRELVFVLDTSGSMSGFPLDKAKETMNLAFEALRPDDTFNLITFAGDTSILFPAPVKATPESLAKARAFLESREGGGGTEMMQAIRTALDPSDRQDHIRIVCFMTDGYVGNDMEIIAEVQKHPNARVFSFGVGDSVNRFLLDRMAVEGRGEVEYVTLADDGSAAARRFHERVQNPLFTDISIDWNGLPVSDVAPARIPDVFSAKPIILTGRYDRAWKGTIRISGKVAGRDVVREVAVDLPDRDDKHDVLASLWARRKVEDLMREDYAGAQNGTQRADLAAEITKIGLDYSLMTQYTSFVAVEQMVVNEGGQTRRIDVPVEMPERVSYDGVFGKEKAADARRQFAASAGRGYISGAPPPPRPATKTEVDRKNVDEAIGEESEVRLPAHLAKLDPELRAIVDRLKRHAAAPASESAFVRDGRAEVRIWLADKSAATMAELSKLGIEIVLDPKTAKMVIARVPIGKLESLGKLASVRIVEPNTN